MPTHNVGIVSRSLCVRMGNGFKRTAHKRSDGSDVNSSKVFIIMIVSNTLYCCLIPCDLVDPIPRHYASDAMQTDRHLLFVLFYVEMGSFLGLICSLHLRQSTWVGRVHLVAHITHWATNGHACGCNALNKRARKRLAVGFTYVADRGDWAKWFDIIDKR